MAIAKTSRNSKVFMYTWPNMLKRRQLGDKPTQNNEQKPARPATPQQGQRSPNQRPQTAAGTPNAQPSGQPPAPGQGRRGRNRRGRNRNANQGNGPQQQQQRQPQRQAPRQPQRRPPPPPDYIQRDLLLIATGEALKGIDEVRAKFDPLAKKVPTHVTLLFPEPALSINKEFLKSVPTAELPSLQSLTFTRIEVHEDMYLWLVPDEESASKLIAWHEALTSKIENHTQGEKYHPHITLGYIPRSITPEDAVAFAKNLISTPLSLSFQKLLLEEFGENQISTPLDTISY
ncbi:MAG: 2'-5' RNA ligase family protein [Oligoflexia bacterium]|nr:2'-5' RNA ligase family protein [Oligoflexia bacterium]